MEPGWIQSMGLYMCVCTHTHTQVDFPGGIVVKNPPANAGNSGDVDFIPELERSPEGGNGNPLQYSCLKNPMDREARWATVHGVEELKTTED